MASDKDFVEYVTEQLCTSGLITYRRMFGEYGLYREGKFFGVVCDNQLFVKITDAGRSMWPGLVEAPPYEGAKPYFLVEDLDLRDVLSGFVTATCEELPVQKQRKPPKRKAGCQDGQ